MSQSLRLYNDSADVEVDWLVGPVPIKDRVGKEVVVVYEPARGDSHLAFPRQWKNPF